VSSTRGQWALLAAGTAALAVSLGLWLFFIHGHAGPDWSYPIDLRIYRFGGLIEAHVPPAYDARRSSPLYDWPGYDYLRFTYSPFAALVFTILTVPSQAQLMSLVIAASLVALVAAVWLTLGGLGYRPGPARIGVTLLLAALLLWTEPVQRTLFLGQIELLLMALVLWDLTCSDRRWWKGAGVGIAAGIKLVPLIFIPYLLLTRRFRQAAVAAGTFAATIVAGFIAAPADSRDYWLNGLFAQGSRTGFVGFAGNQSLRGIITRLWGSVAGAQPAWLAAAAVTAAAGLLAAVLLDRAGDRMLALLTCALTGLLASPISWDHHWVWIVPGITALAVGGARARGRARWAWWGTAAAIAWLFGAWSVTLWGEPLSQASFTLGFIWAPPDANPGYNTRGDQPSFDVYHWHGLQLVVGNLYVLAGVALLALLLIRALGGRRGGWSGGWPRGGKRSPQRPETASSTTPTTAASSATGATR
jgi:alpha-1,2-mannosyltransferase